MDNNMLSDTAPLVKGLGLVVGEIVVGVNGMFLFSRFGLNVPEAVTAGVLLGAAVGYGVAAASLWIRHMQHTPARAMPNIGVKARA